MTDYAARLRKLAGSFESSADHEAACLAGADALDREAQLVVAAKRFLGAYSGELMARARWVAEPEPWSPESRQMFEVATAREAETRDAALALGVLVVPDESRNLCAAVESASTKAWSVENWQRPLPSDPEQGADSRGAMPGRTSTDGEHESLQNELQALRDREAATAQQIAALTAERDEARETLAKLGRVLGWGELLPRQSFDRVVALLRVTKAAETADWEQVRLNGGPPCFHVLDSGKFCFAAERWIGHGPDPNRHDHEFVTLRAALASPETTPVSNVKPTP